MSQTFNDGDPIDASTLQNLKTEVARALALSGSTTSGSTINLQESTFKPAEIVAKKFYGGSVKVILPATTSTNKNNAVTFDINYEAAKFSKKPFIALTAVSDNTESQFYPPAIIKGTVGIEGARGQIQNNGIKKDLIIHFIAVQY